MFSIVIRDHKLFSFPFNIIKEKLSEPNLWTSYDLFLEYANSVQNQVLFLSLELNIHCPDEWSLNLTKYQVMDLEQ